MEEGEKLLAVVSNPVEEKEDGGGADTAKEGGREKTLATLTLVPAHMLPARLCACGGESGWMWGECEI